MRFGNNLRRIAQNEFHIRWFSPSTWVFFVTVSLVFFLLYLIEINEFFNFWSSGYSNDIPIGPKYFAPSLLTWHLVVTTFGAIYLGCNLRAQSMQNRIYEALESRPVSNFELVAGRLLSFIVLTSIPVIVALILISVHGYIDTLFGLGYGDVPEVWSVLAFVVWDIVPNLAFWGALAMFLTLLSRSRLAGALLTSSIYVGWCVLTMGLPLEVFEVPHRVPTFTTLMQAAPVFPFWLLDSMQSFSASAIYPSEIAPVFATESLVTQRLAMLGLAAAFVCGAALFFPRSLVSRRTGALVGVVFVALAIALLASSSYRAWRSTQQTEYWVAAHTPNETLHVLDLEHISGHVELHPAKFMSLYLTLRVRTPESFQAEEGVFAFNPGFRISDLILNGITINDYEFQDGLLIVPWDPKIASAELQVIARGKPKEAFAYMDSVINVAGLTGKRLRRLRNLGTESTIFHSDYVVLLPGTHWYPTPGAATGRGDLDKRATDFYTFDLEITTNRNWLVAAPGKRERVKESTPDTYRVQSSVPVPSIAIVSSRFVRRTMTAEAVEFELLISPNHQKVLEHLAGVEIELKEWLTERLKHASSLGLEYPFERFTVVEVPSSLKIFGGGWQMDSTLAPSGLFLVRESGLLSVRFERDVYRRWDEREQRKKYVLSRLLNKLRLDLVGENPYLAFGKNFLTNQTKPTETGAAALQFVLDRLITQLVLENETYFSIQDLLTKDLYEVYSDLWSGKELAGKHFDQPSVWLSAEMSALSDLEHLHDPVMRQKVLWHKGYAIIRTLRDYYGADVLGEIFRNLLEQHHGGNFAFEDLAMLVPKEYKPIDSVIGDLLLTTKASGYIATQPSVSLIDVPLETDEYLTSFVLYNDEESPSFVRVYDGKSPLYELEGDKVLTEPIWFDGKQAKIISLRSKQPYRSLHIKPYFSLNRAYKAIYPDPPNDQTQWILESNIPPLVESIDWQPSANENSVVVVDDLDPGFSIVQNSSLDQVLPKFPIDSVKHSPRMAIQSQYYLPEFREDYSPDEWHRVMDGWSFGKYRSTLVRIKNGNGHTSARFEAVLPNPGLWRLEYHVSRTDLEHRYVRNWYGIQIVTKREYTEGDIAITVRSGSEENATEFNFVSSDDGWHSVGEYEILEEDVAVLVSDAVVGTQGDTVYADAIRWTYLSEKSTDEPVQK